MAEFWHDFVLTFVPIFIVMDAVGNLPMVLALSEGMPQGQRERMIHIAMITASAVGLVFLFFGQFILQIMNISPGSMTIAGGIILFVLCIRFLVSGRVVEAKREEMVAVVPIGTPLVVGSATITTLLLLVIEFPLWIVLISLASNLIITWLIFMGGGRIARFLGKGGLTAVSQVFNLLLAAIAVSMVIRGLEMRGIINVIR